MAKKSPKFEPIDDRVIIVRDTKENVTPGGIVLPDQATEKPMIGVVVAVGPGRINGGDRVACQCKAGDRVVFSPYAESIKLDDVEYVLCHEADLYAILR